jgi:hypothetical protein
MESRNSFVVWYVLGAERPSLITPIIGAPRPSVRDWPARSTQRLFVSVPNRKIFPHANGRRTCNAMHGRR